MGLDDLVHIGFAEGVLITKFRVGFEAVLEVHPQDEGIDVVRHQLVLDEVDKVIDPLG